MAFIEPMHRNKPNITYLLTVLKLDNDHIQFVKEAKFLGLIWDTKLTFEPHIKYLKARRQKSLNILKVLSRTEWGADRTTLLKSYRSFVRSKLDYGCIVYGSASKTALAKLDPVHNQGLRLSLGAFRSSPVESLYVEGDGGGRPSVMSLGVASVGGHSHGHPASPIGVGSLWEDIDPRSPEPLVVRGGWLWLIWVVRWTTWTLHLRTLSHPARLSWAATWRPCVLGCWGMGGRCTTWPINPPEVYTSFGPDPPGRQAAGCPCQSISWRLCSQSLCADVGWSVCWHCLL